MKVSPDIFRLYDIRGVAGDNFTPKDVAEYENWYGAWPGINITPEVAEAIGQAFATFMKRRFSAKRFLVGHELRPSSEILKTAFIKGVRSTGGDVTDGGVTLTPIVYFHSCRGPFDAAVNITGSHNVSCFNGFKLMGRGAWPIWGDDLKEIEKLIEREDYCVAENVGNLAKADLYPEYEKELMKRVRLHRPLKVVVDTGNGSAGFFSTGFFKKLGCEVVSIYEKVDPTFPNHIPDPEDPKSLIDLGKRVVQEKADLGIGLDADGDRVGAVDENGRFIDADSLLMIFARDVLTRMPGKTILYDVKTSRLVEEMVPKWGGRALMHMTGHAPIKRTMRQDQNIVLAGEMSGHLFFTENYYGIDDGLHSAARLLELVSREDRPFADLFKNVPKTLRTPEFKLPCADAEKFRVVEEVTKYFAERYKTVTIDGVRTIFDDHSWALVRSSNTAPYISLRMEADTSEQLLKIKNVVADQLDKFAVIGDKLNRKEIASCTGRLGWV